MLLDKISHIRVVKILSKTKNAVYKSILDKKSATLVYFPIFISKTDHFMDILDNYPKANEPNHVFLSKTPFKTLLLDNPLRNTKSVLPILSSDHVTEYSQDFCIIKTQQHNRCRCVFWFYILLFNLFISQVNINSKSIMYNSFYAFNCIKMHISYPL